MTDARQPVAVARGVDVWAYAAARSTGCAAVQLTKTSLLGDLPAPPIELPFSNLSSQFRRIEESSTRPIPAEKAGKSLTRASSPANERDSQIRERPASYGKQAQWRAFVRKGRLVDSMPDLIAVTAVLRS